MPVEFVEFEAARSAKGLRMIVVPGIPSPWSEAAKGIFHVKKLPWKAVRLDARSDAMADWAKERSGPVAFWNDEPPRSAWPQILILAERLAPNPALIPADPGERMRMFGIAHEICGEQGLVWARRLQGVQAGLTGQTGGFPEPIAKYLADKYGHHAEEAASYPGRVVALLGLLAGLLHEQRRQGSRYYVGKGLTAVDIYSATAMAMFEPLPPEQCPMMDLIRTTLSHVDETTRKALDPILIEHRDFVYRTHLELPLTL